MVRLALWLEYSALPRYPKWMGSLGWHNHHSWQSRCHRFEKLDLGTYYAGRGAQDGWKQTGPLLSGSDSVANLSPNASEEGPICRRGITTIWPDEIKPPIRQHSPGQVTVSKFEDLITNGVWDVKTNHCFFLTGKMNLATESGACFGRQQTTLAQQHFFLTQEPTIYLKLSKRLVPIRIYCDNQEVLVDNFKNRHNRL